MAPNEDQERVARARAAAYGLGYLLLVHEALNVEPFTHQAAAAPISVGTQATLGHFLTYGFSAGEAAEAGLEVLRGVVEQGQPWPKSGP